MRTRFKTIISLLFLTLFLVGCSQNCIPLYPDSAENEYINISLDKDLPFYTNYKAVCVRKSQKHDAKIITENVESFVYSVLCRAYYGRIGVVDGDDIGEPDLEAELDARTRYIAVEYKDQNFSKTVPYLKYDTFEIKDDTAKVIVSLEMKNPDTNEILATNHEGYIFEKKGKEWILINNIVDTGLGGDKVLKQLEENNKPQEWRTTFAYSQLKRSDYESDHDFLYYWDNSLDADIHKARD